MADSLDVVVIGAGVVGLAVARAFAQAGRDVVVLEAAAAFGTGISARNSEVIHAGIYYPTNSLKATLCVSGCQNLYGFLEQRGVEHRKTGKLIVATDSAQTERLRMLMQQGQKNGVRGLSLLDRKQVLAMEPELSVESALWSPETGIMDSHSLMLALLADAEAAGATLVLDSPFRAAQSRKNGLRLEIGSGASQWFDCNTIINCAGLAATEVAANIAGLNSSKIPELRLGKGSYFSLLGEVPFKHLIYPLPEPGGLGVHLTLDLQGRARFGPDLEWVEDENYGVDAYHRDRFARAIKCYWPDLTPDRLEPAFAGIRPKIVFGGGDQDFLIQGADTHGVVGLINLFGIESPGLTASMSIADYLVDKFSD